MATKFSVPSSPTLYSTAMGYFRGVDLASASVNVDSSRSPECPNMIRDEVGKVRKRTGWHCLHTFGQAVHGIWTLTGKELGADPDTWRSGRPLVQAGGKLYRPLDQPAGPDGIWESWEEIPAAYSPSGRSFGIQVGARFFLLTGRGILVFDGTRFLDISKVATAPTVIISASPTKGGGTRLNPYNPLSSTWYEQFFGEEGVTKYGLSTGELSDVLSVETMDQRGNWSLRQEGTDYSVNLDTGVVTFTTAPGTPPVAGTDNVRIQVKKTEMFDGVRDRILGCRFGILYGVDGGQDRLFLSGNPDYPGLDFYSEFEDPTYFSDTGFCEVCQDGGEITGYSVMGSYLLTHCKNSQSGRNMVVRAGSLDSGGRAVFRTVNTIQGDGTVSPYAMATLDGEPLFLTGRGVYAITSRDITGERYAQMRSQFINPALQTLKGLEEAQAVSWRDFYVLAADGRLWLLDGLQKSYTKDAPNSSYQYECFYWTNVPARTLATFGDALWFGTENGRLCAFYLDKDDRTSYRDDPGEAANPPDPASPPEPDDPVWGTPIDAYWDTPDLDGKGFWRNKTFRYVACRLASAAATGVTIWAQVKGLWRQVYTDRGKARYLDWNFVDLQHFTFSADRTPHTLGGKVKLKKVDKVRFRFRNDKVNEGFGLYGIGFEYTEPGSRYKG